MGRGNCPNSEPAIGSVIRTVGFPWSRQDAVIYAAEHYSTAMLEKLAHWNGVLPANQHSVEITLPAGLSYEVVPIETLAGWSDTSGEVARPFGHEWFIGSRSLLLFVPSIVAGMEKIL